MKKIRINHKGEWVELLYKVVHEPSGEYGSLVCTDFYDTRTRSVKKRKYWLFGPFIQVTEHIFLFRIWGDANDANLTKDDWRLRIKKQLELLDRRKELEQGILI